MGNSFSETMLRERATMLEEQLAEARRHIYELEHASVITERSLVQKAAFLHGDDAEVSLVARRVHRYNGSHPIQEQGEYELSMRIGQTEPVSYRSTDINDIAAKFDR